MNTAKKRVYCTCPGASVRIRVVEQSLDRLGTRAVPMFRFSSLRSRCWEEPKMKAKDDPTIERIRRVRHDISEKHAHDPHRIVQHYKELQKQYQNRLLQGTE